MEGNRNILSNIPCMINLRIYYKTRNYLDYAMDMLYPENRICCFCGVDIRAGTGARGICLNCYSRWLKERQINNPCPVCGFFKGEGNCAGPCSTGLGSLECIWAAAPYTGFYRQIVKEFKYNGRRELAEPLGFLMAEALLASKDKTSRPLLVPVPLHKSKEKERGFNQSLLLAQWLGSHLGLKVEEILMRSRPGRVQAGLNITERRQNTEQVFKLKPEVKLKPGQPVMLVDDVVTTGATLLSCARAIREKSDSKITALCFAAGCRENIKKRIHL